jgi:hypothetical protein
MPAAIFIALLDLGKKSSFVDRHYLVPGRSGDVDFPGGRRFGLTGFVVQFFYTAFDQRLGGQKHLAPGVSDVAQSLAILGVSPQATQGTVAMLSGMLDHVDLLKVRLRILSLR